MPIASDEEKNKRLNRIPLGRFGRAEDIVNAGIFLASDESSWMTGSQFVVGGTTVTLELPAGPYLKVSVTGLALEIAGQRLTADVSFELRTDAQGCFSIDGLLPVEVRLPPEQAERQEGGDRGRVEREQPVLRLRLRQGARGLRRVGDARGQTGSGPNERSKSSR